MMTSTHVIDYPVSDAMRGVVLKLRLTGVKVLRARVWLALQLMKLAACVAGCSVEFDDQTKAAGPI